MNRFIAACAALLAAGLAFGQEIHLKEGGGLRWWKGNTHTHTLWSDGDAAPEYVVAWFKDKGYDFLSLTEHNTLATSERWLACGEGTKIPDKHLDELRAAFGAQWVEVRGEGDKREMRLKTLPELAARFEEPGEFLLVWGEEITNLQPNVHINGINVRENIAPLSGGAVGFAIERNVKAVGEQASRLGLPMFAHLNHPNWGKVTMSAEDILESESVMFFEVFNGHGGVRNWGSEELHLQPTDRLWDIMLAVRLANGRPVIRAMATDDSHEYFEPKPGDTSPGRGWSMVLAPELTPNAIAQAIIDGKYYATTGVLIDEIHSDGKSLRVAIRAEEGVTYTTRFIGTPKDADLTPEPVLDAEGKAISGVTGNYGEAVGMTLHETADTTAVYAFTGAERYVRVKITSSKDHPNPFREGDKEMAWVQPVIPAP